MIYIPDTNVWIEILNPGKTPVKDRFVEVNPQTIWFCSVVKAELLFGAYKSSRKKENLNLLAGLFRNFGSLVFDDESAEIYGKIRADLNSKGTPIGPDRPQ
ncbi:MAG: type II toxin-antitoxin system VapC family toxin [Thermodesulfobacteriota bacterium]